MGKKVIREGTIILVIALVMAMFPVSAFAGTATSYSVKCTQTGAINYLWPGTVTSISEGKTMATKVYSKAKTFSFVANPGFIISDVKIDGKSKGAIDSYYFPKGTTGSHSISVNFKRVGFFVMIDPGHAGYYNKGANADYWESVQVFKLANYLKTELEAYGVIAVGMTKTDLNEDPSLYARGQCAKGYDLFLSIHTNASSSQSPDYPLTIVSSNPKLNNVVNPLGEQISNMIKEVMGTVQDGQVWTRKLLTGWDYYTVIRSSAAVGVPGMIIEHSFHSNPTISDWLMLDENLMTLAKSEAATIANYYGIDAEGKVTPPDQVIGQEISENTGHSLTLDWYQSRAASGYKIYRYDSKKDKYLLLTTIKSPSITTYVDETVEPANLYMYKVRAYRVTADRVLYGKYSEPFGEVTIGVGRAHLSGHKSKKRVTLSWTQAGNAKRYKLYRASSKNGRYKRIATIYEGNERTFVDTGLKSGRSYYYKVVAYNGLKHGDDSNILKRTPK